MEEGEGRGRVFLTYVVVEVGVRHRHEVGGVCDVEQTVEVILAGVQIALEVEVVDPDVGRSIDTHRVAVVRGDAGDLQVSEDDVADPSNVESDTSDGCSFTSELEMIFDETCLSRREKASATGVIGTT